MMPSSGAPAAGTTWLSVPAAIGLSLPVLRARWHLASRRRRCSDGVRAILLRGELHQAYVAAGAAVAGALIAPVDACCVHGDGHRLALSGSPRVGRSPGRRRLATGVHGGRDAGATARQGGRETGSLRPGPGSWWFAGGRHSGIKPATTAGRTMRTSRFALGVLLAVALVATMGACSASSALTETCPDSNTPACPTGATCGGPCDPDASITTCSSISPCAATCRSIGAQVDAGEAGTNNPVTIWECTAP